MTEKWDKLKPQIERICLRKGIAPVANAIPADRTTVYRLLNDSTAQPSRAVEAGIERIVKREGQPED